MKQRAHMASLYSITLLLCGSVMPATGWTHWEGFEAADPATPVAVLRLQSAAGRYAALDAAPLPWRTLFAGDDDSTAVVEGGANAHAGHAGAAQQTPATTQK